MCDLDSAFLIAEFKKTAKTFKPVDVLKFNGTSWDYLSIALSAPDVDEKDHADLVKFANNVMVSAAFFDLGFAPIPSLFKWRRSDRIASLVTAMASIKMPPEPGPTGSMTVDMGSGPMTVHSVPMDECRVQRRRAITAKILLGLEKDPAWRATPAEFEEIARSVGVRERASA